MTAMPPVGVCALADFVLASRPHKATKARKTMIVLALNNTVKLHVEYEQWSLGHLVLALTSCSGAQRRFAVSVS